MRIKGSRINFNTYSIYKHPQGIYIDGKFRAKQLTGQSHFQGETSGYTSGGTTNPPTTPTIVNTIDKFPFTTDVNATDVGDLFQARTDLAGQSSTTHGYSSGGTTPPAVTPTISNTIDKFPFATDTNASEVGTLSQARYNVVGHSSVVNGYTSGGSVPTVNTVDKFPFATDVNASDAGDLVDIKTQAAGQSSSIYGYNSGGFGVPPGNTALIYKFPFASDSNSSTVGDLTQARNAAAGQSSSIAGYTSGGSEPPYTNTIDKFPFATDVNAIDVEDLTQARQGAAGQSSSVSGYTSGGAAPPSPSPILNTIDKFPFSTDVSTSNVGDLIQARIGTGQQV